MSDGWSEGWPREFAYLESEYQSVHKVVDVVPLTEAVPKSELQPILDEVIRHLGKQCACLGPGHKCTNCQLRESLAALLNPKESE